MMTPELWTDYLRGSQKIDALYTAGHRCPTSHGMRCKCKNPTEKICVYWHALAKIVKEMNVPVISEDVGRIKSVK